MNVQINKKDYKRWLKLNAERLNKTSVVISGGK
jgi:hypothetical protein